MLFTGNIDNTLGSVVNYSFSDVNSVPEPSTLALGVLGLAGLAYSGLRRKK